ncbi:MAG TPA: hypothetical protein V6D23_19310, partial [Candidatus Obscuribacterales bacterium]
MSDLEASSGPDNQSEIQETELIEKLLERAGIEPAAFEALVQGQAEQYQLALQTLSGTSFTIHPASRTLHIRDYPSLEPIGTIPLFEGEISFFEAADAPALNITSWESWGSSLCWINRQNGSIEGFLKADQDDHYGLVITPDTSFVYTATPLSAVTLAESYQCIYHRVPKGPLPNTAYDMYLSEDRHHLCISDRAAGRLTLISTETRQSLGQVQVRPPGSSKALNVAFDYYEPRLFITDNQTANLWILSLQDMQLEAIPLGQPGQVFGNIVRSPDILYLYLLLLKPTVSLQYVDIEAGDFEAAIPLKGNFFSNQNIDPCDLMVLTPDQNHLLLVTSHSEPSPFTPGISVIDPHQFQPLRFQSIPNALKEQTKPLALVFSLPNPIVNYQKSRLQLLLDQGWATEPTIADLRQELLASRQVVEFRGPIDHGEQLPMPRHVPALAPQAGEPMVLDPEQAIPAIVFALSQRLYLQTEIDLDAQPAEVERFKAEAEGFRQHLEAYDGVEVRIEKILDKYTLETFLSRQDVLSLMANAALRTQKTVRPPHSCPSCNQRLKGNWDCPSCDLELESPQRALKKQNSSLDSLGALTRFHVLLADPKRKRLLILDDAKTIDWELGSHELAQPVQSLWNALWLTNQHILVVDKLGSQVFECSPSGTVSWSLKQSLDPELVLNQPVKATYFSLEYQDLFLIVDQGNHRVLVVDRKQHIVWQYGVQGVAGSEPGYLSSPSDFQMTFDQTYLIADTGNDRVIELRGDEIIRIFGPEQGLKAPVFAQRLFDQDTLVVDSGNYRVLELDLDGETVNECFYFTDEMGEEMRIDAPSRVFRREKKSVILMDEDKIVEIQPHKQTLIWSSLLKHLARRLEIRRDAFDKRDSYVQSFEQYRMPTIQELIARLREENRLESSSGIAQRIFENLHALIDSRRERDQQRSRSAQARHINESNVLAIPIYVIDRTNQQVVEIDRDGAALWHFGTDPDYKLLRPTHVSETGQGLLIADTNQDRVIEVAKSGQVLQVIGGPKKKLLSKPRSAWRTLQGNTLVSDQGHKRLAEFDSGGGLVWEFQKSREISYPYFALELGKGTILYVDWALHVVKEITRDGDLIWAYGTSSRIGSEENQLASPEYAVRLHSGAILIADTGNHRVIEVSPKRKILWEFASNKRYTLYKPNFCQRLVNGNTL